MICKWPLKPDFKPLSYNNYIKVYIQANIHTNSWLYATGSSSERMLKICANFGTFTACKRGILLYTNRAMLRPGGCIASEMYVNLSWSWCNYTFYTGFSFGFVYMWQSIFEIWSNFSVETSTFHPETGTRGQISPYSQVQLLQGIHNEHTLK